ncbi:uncharacterized protein LY89DRAFT_768417 [Mollisia scopiformis]|uniref:Cupin type-2 domain-containing protein n=1 Tax=Mollisia scopiformis TaxID=149040 RepID=A0A194XPN6_MOLSC|nr:uncharacterized protein LY89DRAFT_768417 [Mollisia scopiformis]KUJ22121.1 hypothetical protein LY89DRAFT_768417 [Mollisia scopiformis]
MADPKDLSLPPGVRDASRRHLYNPVIRDRVIFDRYGQETDGECTEARVTLAPGGGSPLHYHVSYAEHFECTTGTLGVNNNNDLLHLSPGEKAIVPLNTKHNFFNDTDSDVSFIVKLVPAHLGFEKSIYILYGLANDGECDETGVPKSFLHLCVISELGDLKWPGLFSWLGNGVTKSVAAYARWSGEEERLLKKYWY